MKNDIAKKRQEILANENSINSEKDA